MSELDLRWYFVWDFFGGVVAMLVLSLLAISVYVWRSRKERRAMVLAEGGKK